MQKNAVHAYAHIHAHETRARANIHIRAWQGETLQGQKFACRLNCKQLSTTCELKGRHKSDGALISFFDDDD